MADINKLFGALTKCQEQILGAVDSLNAISKEAIGFGGDIARVVPQNLKTSMDQLLQIVQGSGQSSLESVIQYLDNVPVRDLRKQSLVKTTINDDGIDQTATAAAAQAAIDTNPNVSAGPQSAVARESFNLSDFYKEEYKQRPTRRMQETINELSFEDILQEGTLAEQHEDLVNGGDAALRFNSALSETEQYAKRFGMQLNEEDDIDDDDEYDDGDGEPLKEKAYTGTWQDVLYESNPHERDFDDIMNDDRDPFEH